MANKLFNKEEKMKKIKHKCEVCKKESKYEQWSPDGNWMFYFCSKRHWLKYIRSHFYRATPLRPVDYQLTKQDFFNLLK